MVLASLSLVVLLQWTLYSLVQIDELILLFKPVKKRSCGFALAGMKKRNLHTLIVR